MKKTIVGLAVFSLLASPLAADVMSSRRSAEAKKNKERVELELTKRGVDATTARAEVSEMSSRDLEYFAASPRRIQDAAGLLLEEWILGGLMAAGVAAAALFIHAQD